MWTDGLRRVAHLLREGHVRTAAEILSVAVVCLKAALKARDAGLDAQAAKLISVAADMEDAAVAADGGRLCPTGLRNASIVLGLVAGSVDGALRQRRSVHG